MTALAHIPANPPALVPVAETQARLPLVYEAAKQALATCENVDECKDWSDKAAALAAYAKQAGDDELMNRAIRIRGRATRRCGELLKQFDERGRPAENTMGSHGISQRAAAKAAGLSEHQQLQAVRVANIPAEQFEELVESDKPPTITALAKIGQRSAANTKQTPEVDMETAEIVDAPSRRTGTKIFIPEGSDIVSLCRKGIAFEDSGLATDAAAAEVGMAVQAYRVSRQIVLLADRPELSARDKSAALKALSILQATLQHTQAWEIVEPTAAKVWGTPARGTRLSGLAERRVERFEQTFGIVIQSCLTTEEVEVPYLSVEQVNQFTKEIHRARKALAAFASRIEEIHA